MFEAVEELAGHGADQIKVLASGPVNLDNWAQTGPPQFSPGDLNYLAALARDRGLRVMAHANGPEAVKMCIQAGVVSVEHGYFMGMEALELLAESRISWTPTIEPLAALLDRETRPARREMLERIIAGQVEQLGRARALGVHAVLGTDAGSPGVRAGPALGREAAWWLKAGFSHAGVLEAATLRGAILLGLDDNLGRLTPGSLAYVVGLPLTGRRVPDLTRQPMFIGRPSGPGDRTAGGYAVRSDGASLKKEGSDGDGHNQ
jgi:imidazolonepropionase-like amidohydrolase